ncbi:hypothetical protein C0J52_03456 [Blattella germanica]|nr:hypothetical protein C0J52_03456 [Blattella germanica]
MYSRMTRLTILLVLWSIKFMYTVAECPVGDYHENGIVDCSNEGLEEIPQGLNQTLEIVDLSNNSIREINDDSFTNMTQIKEINLSYNTITDLKVTVFEHLTNLEEIDLSYNLLVTIPTDIFINNSKLNRCHLKNNFIKFNDSGPILISTSLKFLDISFCNITSLSFDALSEMPYLEELNIQGNCIPNIPQLQCDILNPLKHLKKIKFDCYECNSSILYDQCSDLFNKLSSCSITVDGASILLPLMKGSIALMVITVLILASIFCFKTLMCKKAARVRRSSPKRKGQSSFRQGPLPELPKPKDDLESHYEYVEKSQALNNCPKSVLDSNHAVQNMTYITPFWKRNTPSRYSDTSLYESIEMHDKNYSAFQKTSAEVFPATSHPSRTSSDHTKNDSKDVFVSSAFLFLDEENREFPEFQKC